MVSFVLSFLLSLSLPVWAESVRKGTGQSLDVVVDMDTRHLDKKASYTWAEDPFRKTPGFVRESARTILLDLKAIVYSEQDRSLAIVNDKTVYENSVIEGFVVNEIGPNYVLLSKGKMTRELQLAPVENKVASKIQLIENREPSSQRGRRGANREGSEGANENNN